MTEVSGNVERVPIYIIPKPIEQLVMKLQDELTPVHQHQSDWFAWQSLPLNDFFKGMQLIRDKLGPGRHKFIDVGSGIGTKLYLADCLGFEPYGIERNADYVAVSSKLFPEYPIYLVDALTFGKFGQFDVIYTFRIARDESLQQEINKYIVSNMKDGAIYFANDTSETLSLLKEERSGVAS